jgi:nucleoside-diphosphate-sugar epimerase
MSSLRSYKNKKIVITGGASFIGSHLAELLLENNAKITIIDNLTSGTKENINQILSDVEFINGDVREKDIIDKALKGNEMIFHLAAMHGGRGYIDTHPVECLNNMTLDHIVYDSAVRNDIQNIVHASSACVYPTNLQDSEIDRGLLKEDQANFEEPGKAFSDGEYGWAKLMGELQLNAFIKQYDLTGTSARIFTAYGERENESHAVIALIAKAILKLDPFPIWGNGKQTRNFTYVKDTVMGLALGGLNKEGFDVINVGSSTHNTVLELCDEIFNSLNWKPDSFDFQLDKPVGVKSRASDNSKILSTYEWEPNITLKNGVANTVDWYASNTKIKNFEDLDNLLMSR